MAMSNAVGENRLMPAPELACKLINADSGFGRTNCSWVLARMLRDFEDAWQPAHCKDRTQAKLRQLQKQNREDREKLQQTIREAGDEVARRKAQKKLDELPYPDEVRVRLRVSVWRCTYAPGVMPRGSGDFVYWIGIPVTLVQLGIAAIPWGIYGEWNTFLVTAAGTALAYASGSLPQWHDEKIGVRTLKKPKRVCLTVGNGAQDAILILSERGHLDLEALAAPQRALRAPLANQIMTFSLTILWVAFLITVAGWQQHTWYLVGVGIIGIWHNVLVAGMKRHPKAWGLDLEYLEQTFVEGKVMHVLAEVEEAHPGAGFSIRDEFFPGRLFPREERFWEYAARRRKAYDDATKNDLVDRWDMPPIVRPEGRKDDLDIPATGRYTSSQSQNHSSAAGSDSTLTAEYTSQDAVIPIDHHA